jgi:hypothetical protein
MGAKKELYSQSSLRSYLSSTLNFNWLSSTIKSSDYNTLTRATRLLPATGAPTVPRDYITW